MRVDTTKNTIVCGDNLEWLDWIPDESVDLCYIDPPFFSNRNYEIIWGNGYEVRSFGDRFAGGIAHYIEWMRPRIELIHKKLKASGSIFLHCDWHAAHRLRCVLDDIFGEDNFRNCICWKRCDAHNDAKNQFSMVHDQIMFYSKGADYKFKRMHTKHAEKTLREWYLYLHLPNGDTRRMTKEEIETQKVPAGARRFNTDNLRSPSPRPNLTYDYKGYKPHKNGWAVSRERMEELDKQGKLLFPKSPDGRIMLKRFLDEQKGPVMSDLWADIDMIRGNSGERLGYPTQKPEALIRRIIEATTEAGDCVLDCFVGGGTTAKVCSELNRSFIVGDVSPVAVRITAERLSRTCFQVPFEIKNIARTENEFKEMDGHKFAELICELTGWAVNSRKSGDGGIDGWDGEGNPIQVKNHANTAAGRPDIQKFHSAIVSAKKKRGVFVAWDFAKTAREYMAEIKREHGIEIIAKPCLEILGHLILPPEKQVQIEQLYQERLPEAWNNEDTPPPVSRAS